MLIKIAQLVLSLTILVTLHEFGHYWFAKKFKCRVDKFYLFFDFLFPFAGILNISLFKKKIGDTEYGLGWFPFGGYVQIAGMVDEQMDKTLLNTEPQPWEFRSKPAWQRLLVMMGGILVNFILGIFIFWMILFFTGKHSITNAALPHGLAVDSTAYAIGLRDGDRITKLDDQLVQSITRIPVTIIMDRIQYIDGTHENGSAFHLKVKDEDRALILKRLKKSEFVSPRISFCIDSVDQNSFASNANLKKGDVILSINSSPVPYFNVFKSTLQQYKGQKIQLDVLRQGDTIKTSCQVSDNGVIGIFPKPLTDIKVNTQTFSFIAALVQGFKDGMELMLMQFKQIIVIFTVQDAHQQMSGFYSMVQQMNPTWDWLHFWSFTAFLSLALAFMNFLPIPMLDGGYIVFILIEMITGKKVSDKVLYYANNVGLFIVLALMIYANLDWTRQ